MGLGMVVVVTTVPSFLMYAVRDTTMEILSMWNFICTVVIIAVILVLVYIFIPRD